MIEEEQQRSGAASKAGDPHAGPPLQDRVREIIREEIARAAPIEAARRPLELIVETSIRYEETKGDLAIAVVDAAGQPRMREEGGRKVPFSVRDFIAEFRQMHPTLFQPLRSDRHDGQAPAVAGPPVAGVEPTPEVVMPKRAEPERDWLKVTSGDDTGRAEPAPEPESEEPLAAPQPRVPTPLGTMARPAPPSRFQVMSEKGKLIVRRARGRLQSAIPEEHAIEEGDAPAFVSERFRDRLNPRVMSAAIAALLLLAAGVLLASVYNRGSEPERVAQAETRAQPSAPEPRTTGAVPGTPNVQAEAAQASVPPPTPSPTPAPAPAAPSASASAAAPSSPEAGTLRGIPEVLDTSTLWLQDKVVRLFGVEWARGGSPDDLTRYLKGREVSCRAEGATETYRCQVGGQDLSKVILYNGGARATSEATAELKTAEERARTERLGVWRRQLSAEPPATTAAQ